MTSRNRFDQMIESACGPVTLGEALAYAHNIGVHSITTFKDEYAEYWLDILFNDTSRVTLSMID